MKPAFWSVQLKSSSKRHMTHYREDGGVGAVALRRKELPENFATRDLNHDYETGAEKERARHVSRRSVTLALS